MDLQDGEDIVISFDLSLTVNEQDPTGYHDHPVLEVSNDLNSLFGPVAFEKRTIIFSDIPEDAPEGTIFSGRYSITTKAQRRSETNKVDNYIEFNSVDGSDNYFDIYNIKVERGTVATAWETREGFTHYNLLEDSRSLTNKV
jgi:hypothetical protein